MATFQTVREIERAIATGLQAIPKSPYFERALKDDLEKAIWEKVYAYPEGGYRRRYSHGGLGDRRLFEITNDKPGAGEPSGIYDFETGSFFTTTVDDEGFMVINEVEGGTSSGSISITIQMEDTATGVGKGHPQLDTLVEKGVKTGYGNMRIPRPFYKYGEELVESNSGYLSDLAARIINQYL